MHQPNPIDIAAKASGEPAFRKEGSWEWKPIVEFMPGNRAAVDYENLGRELGLWDE